MDTRVRDILREKGFGVFHVSPEQTVFEALELMAQKGVGAVLVLDEGRLVGILSERDYARKVILQDRSSRETAVKEIMSSKVLTTAPDTSAEGCMLLMTERHVRHLPVMEGDELIGLVSIGDVVRAVISTRERKIEQLERYIQGYA